MSEWKKLGLGILVCIVVMVPSLWSTETQDVDFLVLPSKNQTRMQAEIYYAFMDAGKRVNPDYRMNFVLFNPFEYEHTEEGAVFQSELERYMGILNRCVPEVMEIKQSHPETNSLLTHIREYMRDNPNSQLAVLHSEIEKLMLDFDFLIIESSDTYGVHPVFYQPLETRIETPDGANAADIMEALYGLFFLDAAFQQDKPVWGTCHGAQVGYIHAGGRLGRLFEYDDSGYDVDFLSRGPVSDEEEVWHIDEVLATSRKDSKYFEYGCVLRPVPEFFITENDRHKIRKMNKDFEHSFGLVEPVPDCIEVISYHPLSKCGELVTDEVYESGNEAFRSVLKDQLIIDAYTYKTMLGTQYHPQYTYDEFDMAIIFEYLLKQLTNQAGQ